MNISGLIRSFLGDTHAAEPKTLELKVGEVVKGLVLQLIADQDALVNIGGVQVRARLETPLKQGQVTLLQVQPESSSCQIVLKPLDASGIQIADDSLGEVLKNVGLPDSTSNRQMIQTLHQSGISLSKDNVQAFAQLQSQVPASLQQEDWVPSAVVAFQKGIPLTPDTVSAVRQAISGPAFHETLQQLDSHMNKLLSENNALSGPTRSALDAVKQVVAMVREVSGQVLPQAGLSPEASITGDGHPGTAGSSQTTVESGRSSAGAGPPSSSAATAGSANQGANPALLQGLNRSSDTGVVNGNGSILQSGPMGSAASPADSIGSSPVLTANSNSADPDAMPSRALPPQPQATIEGASLGTAVAASEAQTGFPDENVPKASARNQFVTSAASDNKTMNGTGAAAAVGGNQQQETTNTQEHWISRLMKALGVEHEHYIDKLPDKTMTDALNNDVGSLASEDSQQASSQEQLKRAETLKSSLLQLMQADDVPPALKESAQQAVQQITGQQLLLNSDRSSMFSHITLFVPLMNANGEQTAAVHIQSRKGARGEIDAQNCRLVFDLRMKSLGDTMVDVQVVDRIVSLRVLNDQPFIQQLLDSHREEIASGLSGIGYQFISLKCSPYPERGQESQGASPDSAGKQDNPITSHLQAAYGKKPYRGMDVRV